MSLLRPAPPRSWPNEDGLVLVGEGEERLEKMLADSRAEGGRQDVRVQRRRGVDHGEAQRSAARGTLPGHDGVALSERTARNSAIQASSRIPILHLLCWCCAERPVRSADDVHEARRVASSLASDRMGRRAAHPYGACGGTCGQTMLAEFRVNRKAAQATLPGRCGLTGAGRDEWIA